MAEPRAPELCAIVTGGGSGIGRGIALRLAQDGYAVGVIDIDPGRALDVSRAIDAASGAAHAAAADVSDEESLQAAIDSCVAALGPPWALVNSAGIYVGASSLEMPARSWRRLLDINLTGAFLAARLGARAMVERGRGGRIVHVASVHSVSPSAGLAAYDASKGGLLMLTRSLALELGEYDITVNALCPGLIIETNLTAAPDWEYRNRVISTIPLRRAGVPADVAGPAAFLCSDEASYITGAMLVVDGGMLLTANT